MAGIYGKYHQKHNSLEIVICRPQPLTIVRHSVLAHKFNMIFVHNIIFDFFQGDHFQIQYDSKCLIVKMSNITTLVWWAMHWCTSCTCLDICQSSICEIWREENKSVWKFENHHDSLLLVMIIPPPRDTKHAKVEITRTKFRIAQTQKIKLTK